MTGIIDFLHHLFPDSFPHDVCIRLHRSIEQFDERKSPNRNAHRWLFLIGIIMAIIIGLQSFCSIYSRFKS